MVQNIAMSRKLIKKVTNWGNMALMAAGNNRWTSPAGISGTLRLKTSKVMAMANTPSLKDNSRLELMGA